MQNMPITRRQSAAQSPNPMTRFPRSDTERSRRRSLQGDRRRKVDVLTLSRLELTPKSGMQLIVNFILLRCKPQGAKPGASPLVVQAEGACPGAGLAA